MLLYLYNNTCVPTLVLPKRATLHLDPFVTDNEETDWNMEDSPTPIPKSCNKRQNKPSRIEQIYQESTPEPIPYTKDKKTSDIVLFMGNTVKFKEFLSKLETSFRMCSASYSRKDFQGKILHTSIRFTMSTCNW